MVPDMVPARNSSLRRTSSGTDSKLEPRAMKMPILGAHQSIAGGYHKAVEIGMATGCQVIQVFTKNTNQWRGKPITSEEARLFHEAVATTGIACPLAHDSYLI